MRWLGKFIRFSFILGLFALPLWSASYLAELDWHWSFYILAFIVYFFLVAFLGFIFIRFLDPIGKIKERTYKDYMGIPTSEKDSLNANFESEKDRMIRESQVVEERIKRKS